MIGADKGNDLFLGDKPLRLGHADIGLGLVVARDDDDLRPAQVGEAFRFRQGHIQVVLVVDDVGRKLHPFEEHLAGRGGRAGKGYMTPIFISLPAACALNAQRHKTRERKQKQAIAFLMLTPYGFIERGDAVPSRGVQPERLIGRDAVEEDPVLRLEMGQAGPGRPMRPSRPWHSRPWSFRRGR